jgi:hypothetical protein
MKVRRLTLARYTESTLESRLAAQAVMADAIFAEPERVQLTCLGKNLDWTKVGVWWQAIEIASVGRLTQR